MREAARRGIKLHEEGKSGDGVVAQTVEDARKMASGTVTEEKWRKIAPWIARHMSDLDNVEEGEVTAGVGRPADPHRGVAGLGDFNINRFTAHALKHRGAVGRFVELA